MRVAAALLALAVCANACSHVYFADSDLHAHGRRLTAAEGPTWNYNKGGSDWPGTCASGNKQSPIAFSSDGLPAISSDARANLQLGVVSGLKVINTGHGTQIEWDKLEDSAATVPVFDDTWQAIFDGSSENKTVRQVPVKPLQFHLHTASEHLVNGELAPVELHIVAAVDNTTGAWVPENCRQSQCLTVFGVSIWLASDPYAKSDSFWQTVVDNLPTATGKEGANNLTSPATLNLTALLPEDLTFATYSGSLTTPPCSEGVQWHMFVTPKRELSAAQLNALQAISSTATAEVLAACPADEVIPEVAAADGAGNSSASTVELGCKTPTGARITNRQVMPLNDRTVFISKP
uniref:carbonic anhydrase n=1 Tax=Chlorella sorokiniana TaxID=3076 RepID=O64462_CHLSO|nr:soluble carbonic anhydrase precursor [Chlorella sorokiniana]